MLKRKSISVYLLVLIFFITSIGGIMLFPCSISNAASDPVSYYGEMVVSGNRINGSKTGKPMQVKGMSFFWSNWGGSFWNSGTVDRMVDEFKCEIVRASYGIEDTGVPYSPSDESKVRDVVNAAIKRGIYVIIDWHSHGAHQNPGAAKEFFSKMAQEFGNYDNVIFEIYNEPTMISWSTIKNYANQVIPAIRQYSNNLVVVGTPTWSQDVDQAANDRVSGENIAYTLHFYAGTHFQFLRDKGNAAMSKGVAIFVTEWGSVNADGTGAINRGSTSEWLSWMDQNKISWCNWAINDKDETSSIFSGGNLTETGNYLKSIFTAHAQNAEWRSAVVIPTTPPSPSTVVSPSPSVSPTPPPANSSNDIPGRIEAENYSNMSGIQVETCNEGGSNVGYIESGDWISYNVNVKTAGTYKVEYRVASQDGGGTISLEQNEGQKKLGTVNVPATGDWQNWVTVTGTVTLDAGSQTIAIGVPSGGYNVNWINFTLTSQVSTPPTPVPSSEKGTCTVDGMIKPDMYFTDKAGVLPGFKVEVLGTQLWATTDDQGYFKIIGLYREDSPYTVRFSKENYLTREITFNALPEGQIPPPSVNVIDIWPGDIQKDNAINMADIIQIASHFNTSSASANYIPALDFNKDGAINMSDVMIVTMHFNSTSASYPQESKIAW